MVAHTDNRRDSLALAASGIPGSAGVGCRPVTPAPPQDPNLREDDRHNRRDIRVDPSFIDAVMPKAQQHLDRCSYARAVHHRVKLKQSCNHQQRVRDQNFARRPAESSFVSRNCNCCQPNMQGEDRWINSGDKQNEKHQSRGKQPHNAAEDDNRGARYPQGTHREHGWLSHTRLNIQNFADRITA